MFMQYVFVWMLAQGCRWGLLPRELESWAVHDVWVLGAGPLREQGRLVLCAEPSLRPWKHSSLRTYHSLSGLTFLSHVNIAFSAYLQSSQARLSHTTMLQCSTALVSSTLPTELSIVIIQNPYLSIYGLQLQHAYSWVKLSFRRTKL